MMSAERLLAIAASVVIVAAVIAGIVLTEGPGTARAERFDQERISDLGFITNRIDEYYRINHVVPEALSHFQYEIEFEDRYSDPRTSEPYVYELLSSSRYRLCATFETEGPHFFESVARIAWETDRPDRSVEPHATQGLGQQCYVVSYLQT